MTALAPQRSVARHQYEQQRLLDHVRVEQQGLVGIVAQKIYRLAHLGNGIARRLARLAHDEAEQLAQSRLQQIGRRMKNARTIR